MNQTTDTGEWVAANTRTFLGYGRYFVPERELQIAMLCDLIPPRPGPFRVVELCCGEGLLAAAILERHPASTVLGLDGSPEMLAHARAALASHGDRFSTALFDLADAAWRAPGAPARAVVSSLAVHHLDDGQKEALYRDVHGMLEPEGVLLIADLVLPATALGVAAAARAWDEEVRRRSLSLDGTMRPFDFFVEERWNYFHHPDPFDKPSRLLDQLKWLARAGFVDVDVFWMKAGHAIFGGRRGL